MASPRFRDARISHEGLAVEWVDVPAESEHETLQLALSVERDGGSEVRFGVRWVRDEEDSPVVFAWDSRTVQERDHESAETAISREGGDVRVLFPRSWVDALVDAHELHGVAVVTVDDVDGEATPVDLGVED
jgi:hypothetical protein